MNPPVMDPPVMQPPDEEQAMMTVLAPTEARPRVSLYSSTTIAGVDSPGDQICSAQGSKEYEMGISLHNEPPDHLYFPDSCQQLNASTKCWIVFHSQGAKAEIDTWYLVPPSNSDDDDDISGWSIDNDRLQHFRTASETGNWTRKSTQRPLIIAIAATSR